MLKIVEKSTDNRTVFGNIESNSVFRTTNPINTLLKFKTAKYKDFNAVNLQTGVPAFLFNNRACIQLDATLTVENAKGNENA
jgi:hypothetical protein